MADYWEEDDFRARDEDDDDDDLSTAPNHRTIGVSAIDLEAKGTHLARVLGSEAVPADHVGMMLAGELFNCQVDKQKLADNKLMRFVTKLASSAPAKGREKRQLVLSASAEFVKGAAPANPAATDFSEVGRTDMSYDDASSTFALPVRVLCRRGLDRLVRVQVVWSQSNPLTGGDSTVLGQHIERFSDLLAKTAGLQPLRFPMTSAACPKGSRATLWRLPITSLHPPCTPYVDLASRRHVSYSVPYIFRRREEDGGPTAAGGGKPRQPRPAPGPAGEEGDLGPEGLLLARETSLESRFPFRVAALVFRPFVKQMEAALGAWNQRYEYERIDQGFFASEAEAFAHGRVLVRLTVAAASDLPLLKDAGKDPSPEDYAALPGGGRNGANNKALLQQAQKLAARAGAAGKAAGQGGGDKSLLPASHPFVAVTLERPRPELGLLVGHTNTEYATQAPVFGSNAHAKLCPHGGRPREAFAAAGATRLVPAAGAGAGQGQGQGQGHSFLFYAPKADVDKANLRFEVFHETASGATQFAAASHVLLDSRYVVAQASSSSASDTETWLPLLDKDGAPAGRLLVRVAILTAPAAGDRNSSSSTTPTTVPASASTPTDPFDFLSGAAPFAAAVPTTTSSSSAAAAAPVPTPPALPLLDAIQRGCYDWTRQAGLSGRAPRECDAFTGTVVGTSSSAADRVRIRYPLEWLRLHVDSLGKELQVLQASLRLWEQATADGRGFRSSDHKMTAELQGVATNVHAQTFVVADARTLASAVADAAVTVPLPPPQPPLHDFLSGGAGGGDGAAAATAVPASSSSGGGPSSSAAKLFYYDLVSTGAPTAHALGFRSGGLMSHQAQMAALQREMLAADQAIQAAVAGGAAGGADGLPYQPTGAVGEIYTDLQRRVLTFEAMAAKTAVRRALVIGQALGIATTSLCAKLDIMLTEDADQAQAARTAHNMARAGFLVCFQGLISTIGKEHGMLEDVAVAMELASLYSFELRPKRQAGRTTAAGNGGSSSSGSNHARSPAPLPASDDLLLAFDSPAPPAVTAPAPASATVPPSPSSKPSPSCGGGSQQSPLALEVEVDEARRRVRLLLEPAAMAGLPRALRDKAAPSEEDGLPAVVVPIVAVLFSQGIDAKQSLANFSNQLKGKDQQQQGNSSSSSSSSDASLAVPTAAVLAAEADDAVAVATGSGPSPRAAATAAATGKGSKKVGGDSTIQPIINRRSMKVLNDYCHRCHPQSPPQSDGLPPGGYRPFDRFAERFEATRAVTVYGTAEEFARSIDEIPTHPMLESLRDALKRENGSHKNVDLLREQERVCLELGGGQVIFCKSGKDRTGMAVTLHQARLLADRHGCGGGGSGNDRLARDANVMRLHGTRLLICDKNVGRLKYAFNSLQLQFMPGEYRPPTDTIEQMLDSIMNRDTT